eukprot:1528495-Lingulodinium_polyedra.AAC.1
MTPKMVRIQWPCCQDIYPHSRCLKIPPQRDVVFARVPVPMSDDDADLSQTNDALLAHSDHVQ